MIAIAGELRSEYPARVRNTSLPLSHGLLPLFEAVINSIHGIEEANVAPESSRIRIVIEREPVLPLVDGHGERRVGSQPLPDITGFGVIDNGVGFNEENFQAFLTLDTDHKVAKGGRGIGRLLWLKAFKNVEVESTFDEGGARRQRVFGFSRAGIAGGDPVDAPAGAPRQTFVRLRDFDLGYRAKSRKTPEAIANALIEHCLWYFVRRVVARGSRSKTTGRFCHWTSCSNSTCIRRPSDRKCSSRRGPSTCSM